MFGTHNPDFADPASQVVGYIDHEAGTVTAPRSEVLCWACLYDRNLSPTAHGIEKLTRAYVEDVNKGNVGRWDPLHCDCCGHDLVTRED